MTTPEQWVIWNGSLGILDMVSIGHVEQTADGRHAVLAPPYGVVGPFSLDELETQGWIAFGACRVMSRQRWQDDQVQLRSAAQQARRTFLLQFEVDDDDVAHRAALDLPRASALDVAQINTAFRRLAKTAHPDAGGDAARYRRISEARDALLGQLARVS